MMMHIGIGPPIVLAVKNSKFQKSYTADGRHFEKKDKRPYVGNNLTNWREMCMVSDIGHSNHWHFGGRSPSWKKSKTGHLLNGLTNGAKFGTVMHISPPNFTGI